MDRRSSNGGCLGCFTVVALVVAVAVVCLLNFGPPIAQGMLVSLGRHATDLVTSVTDRVTGTEHVTSKPSQDSLGYAGMQLDEGRRDVYAQLFEGIISRQETFTVFDHPAADIEVAFKALMRDHPEIFWLDGSLAYTHSAIGSVTTVTPGLALALDQVDATRALIEAEADAVLAAIPADAGEYGIATAAYEYVISRTTYDITAPQSQNIMSVFLNHSSVCAGYAKSYQYLLQRAGMFCTYVEGSIAGQNEDHAWNLVLIDGEYAYVDVTWGDPAYMGESPHIDPEGIIYDYLCLTTDEVLRDGHIFADADTWPLCSSTSLDYYRRHGLFFDTYDEGALAYAFWGQVSAGERSCAFKFADDQALAQARSMLDQGTFLVGDLSQVATSYSYTVSDSLRIVKLYW